MEFKINPATLCNMFALPTVITDENLRLASVVQLKAVLYLFRHSMAGETVTCEQIANAMGYEKEDIVDAMIFWLERGVVIKDGDEIKMPSQAAEKEEKIKNEPAKTEKVILKNDKKHVEEIPVSKPSHEQIAARCEECAQFRELFAEAQAKLGKTIGYEGQATLIMLHDSYGLPIEVILMLIEYAKSKGKTGYAYIGNLGRIWAEKEIDTLESAEAYIEEQSGTDALWREFRQLTGVKNENPTTKQRRFFGVWKNEYGYDAEMIYLAYEICVDNTEKMSLEYMDKILKSWHDSGVKTPADAEKERQNFTLKKSTKKKADEKTKTQSSYDLDAVTKRAIGLKYNK